MAETNSGTGQARVMRAAVLAASVVITASFAAAACGPPVKADPATGSGKLSVIAASFPTPSTGWLLGVPPCAYRAHPCRTLLLRRTSDGGRTWLAAQAPPAGVSAILFTGRRDGWAWRPALWHTSDGGATWRLVRIGGGPVQDVAAADGRVLAATGRCVGQSSPWTCRFQVFTSAAGSRVWRPIPGASGRDVAYASLVVSGETGYVFATTPDVGKPLLLTGPVNGSARWRPMAAPCPHAWSIALATAPGGWLFFGCGSEPGAGQQRKTAYISHDGGRTWRTVAAPPSGGYLGTASMTSGGTIMLSGGRMDVYISDNRGHSWFTSRSLDYVAGVANAGWPLWAQTTSDTTGYLFQSDTFRHQIWITSEAGRHWSPINVH